MPKDERLYARFDIGMSEHPKVMLLSDAAFRALIECTMYARRQLTDGFLDERVAVRMWGREVLDELASNHPERPTLERIDGGWHIRDYDEHQITRADIEKKREAGRMGGQARAKRAASTTQAPASDVLKQNASTSQAMTETETETETSPSKEGETPRKRGVRLSPDWLPSEASRAKARTDAPDVDHRAEHAVFVDYWIAQPGQKGVKTDWEATWRNWMRRKQDDYTARRPKATPTERAMRTVQLATELDLLEVES
ncbi:hypothetical protein EDF22_0618 [Rathayibacter sp. PhB127]|uniref:hypothetical protein n=1 Tax=Rathayibacter sp. PhB127 TaxID=2485176 RepID=UPI000F4C3EF4|nr:hypothetical protein [Rathayibacter sp. PhB127]ROS28887.1 hypothetical protein EDF22_0618 [Rathayibacter sp. PhB127]